MEADLTVGKKFLNQTYKSHVTYYKDNGKILVRGGKAETVEGGPSPRTVLIEFSNINEALKCYHSKEYQDAKKIIKGNLDRHIQIVEGI